jgi:hypothetical protein
MLAMIRTRDRFNLEDLGRAGESVVRGTQKSRAIQSLDGGSQNETGEPS